MTGPPTFTVVTENPGLDSGGRMNLSADANLIGYGGISGLKFSTVWPGGDQAATFSIDYPPWYNAPGLTIGRRLLVFAGAQLVFQGVQDDPTRAEPWTVSAVGLGPDGAGNAACLFSTSPPPAVHPTNDAVDAAIARGALRWRRVADLPDPTVTPPDNPGQIADYLALVASSTGQQWGVFSDAVPVFMSVPSKPKWLIDAVQSPGGRSLGDFWTAISARYLDSATNPAKVKTVYKVDPAWTTVGVVREHPADLTGHGPLTNGQAVGIIAEALPATAPQPVFTGQIVVPREALRGADGAVAELSQVRAGDVARFVGCEPDPFTSTLQPTSTLVDVQLGQVEYDVDSDLLTLTPVGATSRDLAGILTGIEAKRLRTPLLTV